MNREDIDLMWHKALQAAIKDGEDFTRHHFAALVATAEREACAKVCDTEADNPSCLWEEPGCWKHAAENCAAAIRARGQS